MRTIVLIAALAAAVLVTGSAAATDAKNCTLGRYATLPITFDYHGGAMVPFKVENQEQMLLVDTAGVQTMLTESAATRLKLDQYPTGTKWFTVFGGATIARQVRASIEIGHEVVPDRAMLVLPDAVAPVGTDGLLAPDILAAFDADFDFDQGRITLFSQVHCEGKVVYWTHGDYAVVPFEFDRNRHINITVQLDGKEILATVDTGADWSVMSLETARELFALDPLAPPIDGHRVFKSLQLNGVSVNNADIMLVPDAQSQVLGEEGPKLIIGMNVLRRLHLYIAFNENKMYVTPAGAR